MEGAIVLSVCADARQSREGLAQEREGVFEGKKETVQLEGKQMESFGWPINSRLNLDDGKDQTVTSSSLLAYPTA